MFEFLDDIIPLEEDDDEPPKKGRKRYGPAVWICVRLCMCLTVLNQAVHECHDRDDNDQCIV